VTSAKWQLAMLMLLLENGGARAAEIVKNFKPLYKNYRDYLNFVDALTTRGTRIAYEDDKALVLL